MIVLEKDSMLLEWDNVHPLLKRVRQALAVVWPADVPMRLTSLNRSKAEDQRLNASGIHSSGPPWRALDVGGVGLSQDHLDAMAEYVNTLWTYDRNRPQLKCAVSKQHGTGPHIHLQVHKRTERNVDGEEA